MTAEQPATEGSEPADAELRDAGILSEEEFTSKKAEILARM
ncbi:SHOCT domain-containing protein [Streptomyces nigra]